MNTYDWIPSVDDRWRHDDGWFSYERYDVAAAERRRVIEELLADDAGRDVVTDRDHERALEVVLRFAVEQGYDPLVLTPAAVEVLLLHWVAAEFGIDGHYLLKLPGVLGDFIVYGHRRRGAPATDTISTLNAVTRCTSGYWELIDAWRFQRSADQFSSFGASHLRRRHDAHPLYGLAAEVGGLRRLEELDADPLPDEAFELDDVPEDIRPRVEGVREMAESGCAALLDVDGGVEHRTAVRRLLHDVACGDPRIFRRQSRDDIAAAALCLLVGKANAVGPVDHHALIAHFGLASSPSSRTQLMRRAAGVPEYASGVGLPRYLTGATRRRLMERRDRAR